MTAAVARLVSEGISQHQHSTYRHSQHSHAGHGCCQDETRTRNVVGHASREVGKSLVGHSIGRGPRTALVLGLRCRSHRCVCCSGRLKAKARARAFMGASGSKVAMVTLTIDPKDPRWLDRNNRAGKARMVDPHDPLSAVKGESSRYAAWAWNRLTTRYRARYGRSLVFFRGTEAHRSGMVHLHVLVRVESTEEYAWLRAVMRGDERVRETVEPNDRRAGLARKAGFGVVVDVQLARSGGDVAKYVTKAASGDRMGFEVREGSRAAAYVSKGADLSMPRYTRRVSWSMKAAAWAPGWVKPAPIAGFWWRLEPMPSVHAAAIARSQGFEIGDPERFRVPAIAAGAAGG